VQLLIFRVLHFKLDFAGFAQEGKHAQSQLLQSPSPSVAVTSSGIGSASAFAKQALVTLRRGFVPVTGSALRTRRRGVPQTSPGIGSALTFTAQALCTPLWCLFIAAAPLTKLPFRQALHNLQIIRKNGRKPFGCR